MAAKVGGDHMVIGKQGIRQRVPAAAMVPAAMKEDGERRAFMRPFGIAERHAAIAKAAFYRLCPDVGATLSVVHGCSVERSEAVLATGNGGFPYSRNGSRRSGFPKLESMMRQEYGGEQQNPGDRQRRRWQEVRRRRDER